MIPSVVRTGVIYIIYWIQPPGDQTMGDCAAIQHDLLSDIPLSYIILLLNRPALPYLSNDMLQASMW